MALGHYPSTISSIDLTLLYVDLLYGLDGFFTSFAN